MISSRLKTWLRDTRRAYLPLAFDSVAPQYDRTYVARTERFSSSANWSAEVLSLIAAARMSSPVRIADIGCNTGRLAEVLGGAFERFEYVGLDVNRNAIDLAQGRAHAENVRFSHYDGLAMPLEQCSFDIVIFNHSLGHVADVALSLAEAYRVLKPAGAVLVATPNRAFKRWKIISNLINGYDPDPTVLRYFSPASLEAVLAAAKFSEVKTWLGGEAATRFVIDPQRTRSRLFGIASKPRR